MTINRTHRRDFRRWMAVTAMTAALTLSPHWRVTMEAVDGHLDQTFGNGGVVVPTLSGAVAWTTGGIAIQPNGKIVVAGGAQTAGKENLAVVRYNADGSFDSTFGVNGLALAPFPFSSSFASAVVIQSDGKIVAVGTAREVFHPPASNSNFAAARFLPNGTLDASFDGDGRVMTDLLGGQSSEFIEHFEDAHAAALQADGKIVAVGRTQFNDNSRHVALVRYNTNGSLDTSFDGDGKRTAPLGGAVASGNDVAIQSGGKILVGGTATIGGKAVFAVSRYNVNGSVDSSFGLAGHVTTAASSAASGRTIALQPDGRIILGGDINTPAGGNFALARYTANGVFDPTFNGGSLVVTPLHVPIGVVQRVALQANGKIVAAGSRYLTTTGAGDFLLARYETDGDLDLSFGNGGFSAVDLNFSNDHLVDAAIQSDGKIVVTGTPNSPGFFRPFTVARFDGPQPLTTTFFLQGAKTIDAAGGYPMQPDAPGTGEMSVTSARSWISESAMTGTYASAATFQLTLPCVGGVSGPKTVRLTTTDLAGGQEQLLGQTTTQAQPTCKEHAIDIPVSTPLTLVDRRLKLTISSASLLPATISLGEQTFLRGTSFMGTP